MYNFGNRSFLGKSLQTGFVNVLKMSPPIREIPVFKANSQLLKQHQVLSLNYFARLLSTIACYYSSSMK